MAVTVEQKTKMYDTPENTSINESHGIPSQNPDAPSQWGWQSFLTLMNHIGVNFSQIKGVAQSATNPGASKVGDVWFWGDYGSYPYFGQPVTEFNQIGFFLKGASSWSKYTIKTFYSYSIKDGETGETIEKQLDDVTRYDSSTGNFELRGESIRDATITLASFSQAVLDYIGSGGTITNNPDERHLDKFTDGVEKLRIKDGFEGKTYLYNPGQYATAADLKTAVEALIAGGDVHLVIDENIDGGGLTWTFPENTIIEISKGSLINNVTLEGDYRFVECAYQVFGSNVTFNDHPKVRTLEKEMFNSIDDYLNALQEWDIRFTELGEKYEITKDADNIYIEYQSDFDSLSSTLNSLASGSWTSETKVVNVVFRRGVYRFNDTNKISMASKTCAGIDLIFTKAQGEEVRIISDGYEFAPENMVSRTETHNVFARPTTFTAKDVFINEKFELVELQDSGFLNEGVDVNITTSQITVVDTVNFIAKMALPSELSAYDDQNTAFWQNSLILWDSAYESNVGAIQKTESGELYFYFDERASMWAGGLYDASRFNLEVNGDYYNYNAIGMYAHFRIINVPNLFLEDKITVDDNYVYIPFEHKKVYQCIYNQFLALVNDQFNSIQFKELRFSGSAIDTSMANSPYTNIWQSKDVYFENCKFNAIGAECIKNQAPVSGDSLYIDGGENPKVISCTAYDLLSGFTRMNGDDAVCKFNKVTRCGIIVKRATAIHVLSKNMSVYRNKVVDASYMGIKAKVVSFTALNPVNGDVNENLLYHTKEFVDSYKRNTICDGGQIYNIISDGTLNVYNNVIYNIRGKYGYSGIYGDLGCKNTSVYGNLIFNILSGYTVDFRYVSDEADSNTGNELYDNILIGRYRFEGVPPTAPGGYVVPTISNNIRGSYDNYSLVRYDNEKPYQVDDSSITALDNLDNTIEIIDNVVHTSIDISAFSVNDFVKRNLARKFTVERRIISDQLVQYPNFENGSSGWVITGVNSSIEIGYARVYSPAGYNDRISQNNALEVGKLYKVSYTILANDGTAGWSNASNSVIWKDDVGYNTQYIIADEAYLTFKRYSTGTDITFTNVKVFEISFDTASDSDKQEILDDIIMSHGNNIMDIRRSLNETYAKKRVNETGSTTLNLFYSRVFNLPINGTQQWLLTSEETGDEVTIYSAAGTGALNALLFDSADGKTVTVHQKIDTYDNTKPAITTCKILKSTTTTILIAYTVWQPLS